MRLLPTAAVASDTVAAVTECKSVLFRYCSHCTVLHMRPQPKLFLSPVLYIRRSTKLYFDDVSRLCRNKCFKDTLYANNILGSEENTRGDFVNILT
jgi:hypothetical protein